MVQLPDVSHEDAPSPPGPPEASLPVPPGPPIESPLTPPGAPAPPLSLPALLVAHAGANGLFCSHELPPLTGPLSPRLLPPAAPPAPAPPSQSKIGRASCRERV